MLSSFQKCGGNAASRPPCGFWKRGFTLLEMLVVIAILGVVVGWMLPAISEVMRGSALQQGANHLTALVEQARQVAVSKNTMSALVILTDAKTPQDYRAFALLEYAAETGWRQTGDWEFLPEGVIVDGLSPASSLLETPPVFPLLPAGQDFPAIKFQGAELLESGFRACLFMPSGGRRDSEKPAQIRLVQGHWERGLVVYTNRLPTGQPADFIDLAIVGVTGSVKTSRPS